MPIIIRLKPIIICTILLAAWLLTPLEIIPMMFLKREELKLPYAFIFFAFLSITLVVFQKWIDKINWIKSLVLAAIVGQIISLLSLWVANFFDTGGIERFVNSYNSLGLFSFIIAQFVYAGFFLGWLIAPLALVATKTNFFKTFKSDK